MKEIINKIFKNRKEVIPDLEEILKVINPPAHIKSMDHIKEIITRDDCYTVVEEVFFHEVVTLFKQINDEGILGDILVTGVWKGGSSLFLQALNKHFELGRELWLSDTFEGFIKERLFHKSDINALELFNDVFLPSFPQKKDIRKLFKRCNLWDDNVHILKGPLEETLVDSPFSNLCFLHIDVDFYEPTLAALEINYPKLAKGGYVVIDDYGVDIFDCREAVTHFRTKNSIDTPIIKMSNYIAYWKKE